jgi:CBS domain-containing protein
MTVEDIMRPDPGRVDVSGTLRDAVQTMLTRGSDSVIVVDRSIQSERGIVTRTDVVRTGYRTDRQYSRIDVEEAMSSPLITIPPGSTVDRALQKMRHEEVTHLVVVDDGNVVGMVSARELVFHKPEALDSIRDRGRKERRGWFR